MLKDNFRLGWFSRRQAIKIMGLGAASAATTFLISPKHKVHASQSEQSIPYIIRPRNTLIDTRRPILRWNKVPGATFYTIKIVTDNKIVWERQVKGTEFVSSVDLPLEPTVNYYSLIVESDNGRSSQTEPNQSLLSFGLLDEVKKAEMQNDIDRVKNLNLPDEQEIRALSDIYISYELNVKAIDFLEQKIANESINSPFPYQNLGCLYLCMGFYTLAEKEFDKALPFLPQQEQLSKHITAQREILDVLISRGQNTKANHFQAKLAKLEATYFAQI